ncbi:MAG: penicillin-binding protein activator, partial [gamma proteobacterium symbiont of Bathyaustriella thionipta]|nr:penicillin-binding protein activator [gamma proteobacterium symbiont of Bathyaustriella thionipta]
KQIPLQVIYHHGESVPIYSTAHIVANYHDARQNIDMDGVNFSDMPFLLGSTENTTSQQNTYQNSLYQRLFAMGVDSYQLAPYVNFLYKNPSESYAGDTGQITIDHNGHIIRALPWATFDQGNIKLINMEINQDNASLY